MHFENMDDMLAEARASGAKFYMEVAEDGMFFRTTDTNLLVVRFGRDDTLTFYDPQEVDIYHINEFNEHMEHDSGHINMLLDSAWGIIGFGEACENELGGALMAVAELSLLNGSGEDFDNE